jgi:hypothetical protein
MSKLCLTGKRVKKDGSSCQKVCHIAEEKCKEHRRQTNHHITWVLEIRYEKASMTKKSLWNSVTNCPLKTGGWFHCISVVLSPPPPPTQGTNSSFIRTAVAPHISELFVFLKVCPYHNLHSFRPPSISLSLSLSIHTYIHTYIHTHTHTHIHTHTHTYPPHQTTSHNVTVMTSRVDVMCNTCERIQKCVQNFDRKILKKTTWETVEWCISTPPIRLHGVVLSKSTGTSLPYFYITLKTEESVKQTLKVCRDARLTWRRNETLVRVPHEINNAIILQVAADVAAKMLHVTKLYNTIRDSLHWSRGSDASWRNV